MKIIANVDFSEQLKKGDSYELPDSDGRLLIAAGLATAAPASADTTSIPAAESPAVPVRSRTNSYSRRDRQASDSSV